MRNVESWEVSFIGVCRNSAAELQTSLQICEETSMKFCFVDRSYPQFHIYVLSLAVCGRLTQITSWRILGSKCETKVAMNHIL